MFLNRNSYGGKTNRTVGSFTQPWDFRPYLFRIGRAAELVRSGVETDVVANYFGVEQDNLESQLKIYGYE